jgi:3-deoxy-D-manno-octulosonic-acid transferase
VTEVYQQLAPRFPQLRLILVPRNRRRFARVARMLRRRGVAFQRRTELTAKGADPRARVLLVDSVGELAAWWGTADIGFVGASLVPRGGHNMIEPAARGVATCFGPHTADFRDVVGLLLGQQAAVQVADPAELTAFVERCLLNPAYAAQLGARAKAVCRSQTGAMQRTSQRLGRLLGQVRGLSLAHQPEVQTRVNEASVTSLAGASG